MAEKPVDKDRKMRVVRDTAKTNEAMQEMERLHLIKESQSSVDITQDAKGQIKLTVKAYADSAYQAWEEAFKTFEVARKKLKL